MDSQPKLFAVCIGFDRSTDYGISQLAETDDGTESGTSTSGIGSGALSIGSNPTRISKQSGHPTNLASHFSSGSIGNGVRPPGVKLAQFSIGGSNGGCHGSLRECDSDSAVDFMIGRVTVIEEVRKCSRNIIEKLQTFFRTKNCRTCRWIRWKMKITNPFVAVIQNSMIPSSLLETGPLDRLSWLLERTRVFWYQLDCLNLGYSKF